MKQHELAMLQEGRAAELISTFKERARTSPNDAEARMDLANAYEHLGRLTDAVQAYEELLEIQPDHPNVLVNLGIHYHRLGRTENAIESLEKVIGSAETQHVHSLVLSLAHTNLGCVYQSKGDFDRAVHCYRTAISIDAGNHLAPKYLAALKEAGDSDHGIVRMRVRADGSQRLEVWHYSE